jgi:hypothetical protein
VVPAAVVAADGTRIGPLISQIHADKPMRAAETFAVLFVLRVCFARNKFATGIKQFDWIREFVELMTGSMTVARKSR